MATVEILLGFGRWWLYLGLLAAAAFLAFGLDRVDPDAKGAFVFRALLIPGLVLLWPLVLIRWLALARGELDYMHKHRPPRAAHGRVWSVLAALIPLVFVLAMALDQPQHPDAAPVQLSKPPTSGG